MKPHKTIYHIIIQFAIGLIAAWLITPAAGGTPVTAAQDIAPAPPPEAPAQGSGTPRHIGYGISVAANVPSRPDLLNDLGMNWVMIYQTEQLADYPNQHVIYRIDFQPDPNYLKAWLDGLPALIQKLRAAGVDAVQIGNEPNYRDEWHGHEVNAVYFTRSLCGAYDVVKRIAPDMVVIAGGIAPTVTSPDRRTINDLDFLQEMFNYGGGRCFDALGYHPYGWNQPPEADPNRHELVFRRTERVYNLMWNNGIRDKQIWLTEFGWVRDPAEGGLDCTNNDHFRSFNWMKFPGTLQAEYTTRAFDFADSNWPWVGPMILWNLNWSQFDAGHLDLCSHMRWYSLLDNDGQPQPVYQAVKNMTKRPPAEYRPTVGAYVVGLTRTAEAGCAGTMRLGSFTVRNAGYPGHLDVDITPANGPGRPEIWTNRDTAVSGSEIEVFVDATDIDPGLHLLVINLTATGGGRMSSYAVRGWLLIHYPTTPECVARYNPNQ